MFSTMCLTCALEMHRSSAPYSCVDLLERERNTVEGLVQPILHQISHHDLRWDGRLFESQEGLETKDGLRADLVVHVLWNQALVRCLTCSNYGMPELVSDDLVMDYDSFYRAQLFAWPHTLVDTLSVLAHVFICHVFQMTWDERQSSKLVGSSINMDRMSRHARRFIYNERTLIGGFGGTVVSDRVPVPVVNLSNDESIEGPTT
ncbi:hypothetical protein M9H77_35758 [Catharanthus roseus]|uniref:Uncharacterized protein n=1 Tax=Catharanthus roseus TaxID=4058 RepID=A0ACB9ZQN6_CATRO|nr:hypothetical protein M9H77_35758 [Catharanthus roseus]